MSREVFYNVVRKYFGPLDQGQVDGFERYLNLFDEAKVLRNQGAYVLATVWHETGQKMQPVRETFAESDEQAIARLNRAYAIGSLRVKRPYWRKDKSGKAWFGRGDIQITHKANYERVGDAIGIDLVTDPNVALKPEVSLQITWIGMRDGLFTGKKLSNYITTKKSDFIGARPIVNGMDRASLIAGYAKNFNLALSMVI